MLQAVVLWVDASALLSWSMPLFTGLSTVRVGLVSLAASACLLQGDVLEDFIVCGRSCRCLVHIDHLALTEGDRLGIEEAEKLRTLQWNDRRCRRQSLMT